MIASLWRVIIATEKQKAYRFVLKLQVLTHYGNGSCSCIRCNFADIRALTISHIEGKQHQQEVRRWNLYRWLAQNDYPEGYQTLCMNCLWIKRIENRKYGGA